MGKSQRRKGGEWEREVVQLFRKVYPPEAVRRNLQSQGGSVVGSDVLTPDFAIECKHAIKPSPRAALQQCEEDNPKPRARWCVAVIKDHGAASDAFVVMRLNSFLGMVGRMTGRQ